MNIYKMESILRLTYLTIEQWRLFAWKEGKIKIKCCKQNIEYLWISEISYIIVDIRYFNWKKEQITTLELNWKCCSKRLKAKKKSVITCERANSFQTWFTLIGCLNSDWYKFSIITLTVEHFIGWYFTGLFIDGEFGTFLIRLLNYGVFDLTKDN